MDEDEIRFRFLFGIYQKNNGEHTPELIDTYEIVKMSGLEQVDENLLINQVTYLNKESLIGGDFADGKILPTYVSTTNWGIETVEQIMNELMAFFNQNTTGKINEEIEKIQREESITKQYLNLWEYTQQDPKLKGIFKEKIAKLISDPGF